MSDMLKILPCGDCAATVVLGNVVSEEVNARVTALCDAMGQAAIPAVTQLIPTYTGVTVHYDPELLNFHELCDMVRGIAAAAGSASSGETKVVEIPVCYQGEYAPDIEAVAQHCGLTVEEVVQVHSAPNYLIYMLGFMPGYPYMGGMDPRLSVPRLITPRAKTPEGAVGIAGAQTGIYSVQSPGGWMIIGRTPLKLFDSGRTPPNLLEAGWRVRFRPITEEEYAAIRAEEEVRHA